MAVGCLKCGRDVEEGQVFCAGCLEVMAKYPVKPGIAIQLPGKREAVSTKKSHTKRKHALPLEEQNKHLRKRIRRLVVLWLVTLALLAATIYPTVQYFLGSRFLMPGQNYTTITTIDNTNP